MIVTPISYGPNATQLWASQQQEKYAFVSNVRDGFYYLLLVDTAVLASGMQFVPLSLMEFTNQAQLSAACKWVAERRDRWQAWGALGSVSYERLHDHLADLLRAEPMDMAVWAYELKVDPKRRTISLARLVSDHSSMGSVPLWSRTYRSRAQYTKACRWFDRNSDNLGAFDDLGAVEGPAAIDAAIAA